jgi:hypothetical protein
LGKFYAINIGNRFDFKRTLFTFFIVCILVSISLISIIVKINEVQAVKTVTNPDGSGYWEDIFENIDGIETLENLVLKNGNISLENKTDFIGDFIGTDGDPPNTTKWDLVDDGYTLEIENNLLKSEITVEVISWKTEMVRTKEIFNYNHTISWRQRLKETDINGMYYHFFVLNGTTNYRLFGCNINHENEYHPTNLVTQTSNSIRKINTEEWFDFSIIFKSGYLEFFLNGESKYNYTFNVTSVKYEFGVHSLYEDILVYTGNTTMRSIYQTGNVTSKEIVLPENKYWEDVTIGKINETADDQIKVTVLDGKTLLPITGFENLSNINIDISGIDPNSHSSIRLLAHISGSGLTSPILQSWKVSWINNDMPDISSILFSEGSVLRTQSITISAIGIDTETIESELIPTFNYKGPNNTTWQTDYLLSPYHASGKWNINFTPSATADLGYYDVRVKFEDYLGAVSNWAYSNDSILVLNNKPSAPVVNITPLLPKTLDILTATISNVSKDVENEPISYTYRWYLNGDIQDSLTQNYSSTLMSTVPHTQTQKDDKWKCVVTPNDGNDNGTAGISNEIVIQNSPVEVIGPSYDVITQEDKSLKLENILIDVFTDVDDNKLTFNVAGQVHLDVKFYQENGTVILIPQENWFGYENITFSASDGLSALAQQTLRVTVKPANDLPIITKVGDKEIIEESQIVDFTMVQDDVSNITVEVEDIDGDVARGIIGYSMNVTPHDKLYLSSDTGILHFNPTNDDVGLHFIRIQVTDNNETPLAYVYQDITIRVINLNDPPSVEIIKPEHNKEFSYDDNISFDCIAGDIDLLIRGSNEHLTYKWSSNVTGYTDLGNTKQLNNLSLPPGYHNITIIVTDVEGASDLDFIHIRVKEKPIDTPDDGPDNGPDDGPDGDPDDGPDDIKKQEKEQGADNSWIMIVVIIIIIIFVLLFIVFYMRKRKKEPEESEKVDEHRPEQIEGDQQVPLPIPTPITGKIEPPAATPQPALPEQPKQTPPQIPSAGQIGKPLSTASTPQPMLSEQPEQPQDQSLTSTSEQQQNDRAKDQSNVEQKNQE